jgi:hypothetical protein
MSPAVVEEEFDGAEVSADLSTITAMTRGEVDTQVLTARRFPRSVSVFLKKASEMACLNQEIAEQCMYALPRGGKTIEGPSARFAEIVASAWGHLRIEGRPVDEGERFVTVRGTSWDMENNVAIAFEVKRRITDKYGARFNDDMIGVTTNAAGSIAIRNSVLKVIPKAFWGPIYHAARKVAVGDATTLATRRAEMLAYFLKLGAANEKVFALIGVKGVEDITLDHLAVLKGVATAIKEGDTTVEQAFSDQAIANGAPAEPQRRSQSNGDQGSAQRGEARSREMPSEPTGAVGGASPRSEPPSQPKAQSEPPEEIPQSEASKPVTAVEGAKKGTKKKANAPANGNADGPSVTSGAIKIIHTEFTPARGDEPAYYEIRGQIVGPDDKPRESYVFYTQDESLYQTAASCEGSDTKFRMKWHGGTKYDGTRCKVLESIEAEN